MTGDDLALLAACAGLLQALAAVLRALAYWRRRILRKKRSDLDDSFDSDPG